MMLAVTLVLTGCGGTTIDSNTKATNQTDVSGTDGQSTTDSAQAFVKITAQPVNQMVNEGVNVSLSVVAAGSGSLGYQWYFNGAKMAGANAAKLMVPAVTTANDGNYYVVVSSGGKTVVSRTVSLSVAANTLKSARLSWKRPSKRSDDSALAESEIEQYEIYYSNSLTRAMQKIDSVNAASLGYTASGLEVGTHYFSLVTVDTTGMKSPLSAPVSITIN